MTGAGAIGVEFAGTGVTSASGSFGVNGPVAASNNVSLGLVKDNIDLQWNEGHFRGFFTLSVTSDVLDATYYSLQNVSKYITFSPKFSLAVCAYYRFLIAFRNLDGFASAKFRVKAGANRLTRPVANGSILSGALKPGNH